VDSKFDAQSLMMSSADTPFIDTLKTTASVETIKPTINLKYLMTYLLFSFGSGSMIVDTCAFTSTTRW